MSTERFVSPLDEEARAIARSLQGYTVRAVEFCKEHLLLLQRVAAIEKRLDDTDARSSLAD